MTTVQVLGYGAGLTYLIGVVWFLFLERRAGFLFWRLLTTVFSPLTVPLLALIGITLMGMEKFFSSQPSTIKK